jgi:uncharacterized protein
MGEGTIIGQYASMPINFIPPQNAAWLYLGKVMHARFKPKQHRFNYSVFNLCIDLDQLAVANKLSRFFSIARFNLLSFYERDHCTAQDKTARGQIDRLLLEAGITQKAARVLLLCYPRVLGFVFNPISVYFCYDVNNLPVALVYEVRNTFKQRHTYVAPIVEGQMSEAGIRQERDKLLYVSPFMDMQLRYFFRVKPPQDEVTIRILEKDVDGPILAATFHGVQCDLTTKNIVRLCVTIPFMTLKVVLGIHYEALKLWLKGVRIKTRPAPPKLASYSDLKEPTPK